MIFHSDRMKHMCEEMGVGKNGFFFPFDLIMNVLTMGATTQGDVACYVVWETIWGSSHGCKILKGGHGWEKKNWIYTTYLQFIVNFPPSLLKQFEL